MIEFDAAKGDGMCNPGQPRAVRFDHYGGREVLYVTSLTTPTAGPGQVVVQVKAAGINPGESKIREGVFAAQWPAVFPSGQGSDLAGVVIEVGSQVHDVAVGDEVLGFTWDRASHATHVAVLASQLVPKPSELPWTVAGSLYVVGVTAVAAVGAVAPKAGETVVVSAAAGGVGSLAVQLLRDRGCRVIGIASERHHAWLESHGVIPVSYGPELKEALRAMVPDGIDAFIDLRGDGYVEFALALGIAPERIETTVDFEAARRWGTRSEGSESASSREVLSALLDLILDGRLTVEIAATYPLDQVAAAFRELEQHHTRGKIVLLP